MSHTPLLKVLWIEDQPKENADFVSESKLVGFELINVLTAEEGIDLLKADPDVYAAIILDALGFRKTSNDATSTAGLYYALREIRSILPDIPKVIFTGEERLFGNEEFHANVDIPVFYKQDDNDPLFKELRKQIANRPDASIRRLYQATCSLCAGDFLPTSKWSETLFPALKEAHEGTLNPDRFNGLRKVLEAALKHLCANGILPGCFDENGHVNLKYCELLLNGRSVTPHQQDNLHYYPLAPLLDKTDNARLQLLKILCSEESHENQCHRTAADQSCATFSLISLLPALKELSQRAPTWKTIDMSKPTYEIPGQIKQQGQHLNLAPAIKTSLVRLSQLNGINSYQAHDKVWVKCRDGGNGNHHALDIRTRS